MIISVSNNLTDIENVVTTYSSTNISSGGTTIPVKNINSFNENWAIQIGATGEAESEIKVISGVPSGTALNLSAGLSFDHSIDTPVFQIHYDQIIFKRSTSGTAGTATAIGTQSITPNLEFTQFNDPSGSSTYAYKTQFYNSVSGDVSSESDWFIPGGPTFYSLQALRKRMKDSLFNANYLKDDSVVDDWINEWIEQMTNAAIKVNQGYSMGTAEIGFGTAGLGTVTMSDFKTPNKIEITYDGVSYANSHEIPVNRFNEQDNYSALNPKHYWVGDTVFGVLPNGNEGTARITYSRLPDRLVDDADELPLSLRSYTTSCVEYVLYKAFDNDLKREYATDHFNKFLNTKNDFIHEITPRDQTGIKVIDFTDSLSGGQDTIDIISDFII